MIQGCEAYPVNVLVKSSSEKGNEFIPGTLLINQLLPNPPGEGEIKIGVELKKDLRYSIYYTGGKSAEVYCFTVVKELKNGNKKHERKYLVNLLKE